MLVGNLVNILANDINDINEIGEILTPSMAKLDSYNAQVDRTLSVSSLNRSTSKLSLSTSTLKTIGTSVTASISNVTLPSPTSTSIPKKELNVSSDGLMIGALNSTSSVSSTRNDLGMIPNLERIVQPDSLHVADFVIYGFFFICIVQIIALLSGANISKAVNIFQFILLTKLLYSITYQILNEYEKVFHFRI